MRYRRGAASCGLNRRLLTSRGMLVNRIGKVVVAGICSPSHDCYVEGKVGRLQPYMYASQRARMIELALAGAGENAWVTPGVWEAAQDWFVDFPAVAKHYASCLARHFPKDEITLAFLCGTDHIRKVTQQLQLGMHACSAWANADACTCVSLDSLAVPVTKRRLRYHSCRGDRAQATRAAHSPARGKGPLLVLG